jgi:hypothetical protein
MRIPNPPADKQFDRVIKDEQDNPVYGVRNEFSPEEEIVHISSNTSNHKYYTPEKVLNPEGCTHEFIVTDLGKREVECTKCNYGTTFVVGVNYFEDPKPRLVLHKKSYPITHKAL